MSPPFIPHHLPLSFTILIRPMQLASTKKIRVAYMGKILKESLTLEAQGWQPGHVVNALVFNR